jgi:hypothetical protein
MPMLFVYLALLHFVSLFFLQPLLDRAGETPALQGAEQIDTGKKIRQILTTSIQQLPCLSWRACLPRLFIGATLVREAASRLKVVQSWTPDIPNPDNSSKIF